MNGGVPGNGTSVPVGSIVGSGASGSGVNPAGIAGPATGKSAAIDGARRFAIFRHVTVPLLGPTTLFLVVWSTINALQLFDEVYFLTKGGPLYSTYVLVYYVFDLAFQKGVAGYAAAVAYTLFLAILALTALQLWLGRRLVHYSS